MWKNCSPGLQDVEITLYDAWGSSKEILLIYYYSLPDEGGENKICQYLSLFLKILTGAGSVSFYGSLKGDEGADTDLMIQFCLP